MYTHVNLTYPLTYLLALDEVFPPEVVPLFVGRSFPVVADKIKVTLAFSPHRNARPVRIACHAVLGEYVDPHLGRVTETRLYSHQIRLAGGSLTKVGQQVSLFRVRT